MLGYYPDKCINISAVKPLALLYTCEQLSTFLVGIELGEGRARKAGWSRALSVPGRAEAVACFHSLAR